MENLSATQMADLYGLPSSIAFNKLLVKCGLLMHTDKGFVLAESMRGHNYVKAVDAWFFLPNGTRAKYRKPIWTEAGQQLIRRTLLRLGIVPTSEQTDLFANN